jgi:phosphoadenosine phosphosulfate reductase family protein
MNPFDIDGPAVISFSGGRTSAYMLWRILESRTGIYLPDNVHVLFADTGKERDETYLFVNEIEARWPVSIHWVERAGGFTQLITDKKFLPNPVARFCTTELKLVPIQKWMKARGYTDWDTVVGIRADEPKRVVTMRERGLLVPLADAGITEADILAFWRAQPFDLQLRPHESNCDLCFLKGVGIRRQIIRDHPELTAWWIEQERRIGGRFRSDAPSYADIAAQPDLFVGLDDSLTECFCHD